MKGINVGQLKLEAVFLLFTPSNPGNVSCSVKFIREQFLCCGCDINTFISQGNRANNKNVPLRHKNPRSHLSSIIMY